MFAIQFPQNTSARGLTLAEILVVVAIIALIFSILVSVFRVLRPNYTLDRGSSLIVGVLEDARSRTLSSKEGRMYGVHIETFQVVLFRGDAYDPDDTANEYFGFPGDVVVSSLSLSGSGDNIIFERLTGETSNNGTIDVSLLSSSTASHIINIDKTGIIYLQEQ